MSIPLAYELPAGRPQAEPSRAHVEIVSTRAQRRARPKLVYALIAVAGLFAILIAQLLISISLSDNAYRISSLQSQQKVLAQDQQQLTEDLQVLQSPQNLSTQAASLGMVLNNGSAGWIDGTSGAVVQAPTAAGGTTSVNATGDNAIANSLLAQDDAGAGVAVTSTDAGSVGTPGAPAAGTPGSTVTSDAGGLPSPNTH